MFFEIKINPWPDYHNYGGLIIERIEWFDPLHDMWGLQVGLGQWHLHGYAADPLCAGCVQVFLDLTFGSTLPCTQHCLIKFLRSWTQNYTSYLNIPSGGPLIMRFSNFKFLCFNFWYKIFLKLVDSFQSVMGLAETSSESPIRPL